MGIKKNQFNELRGYCFELLKSIVDVTNAELKGAISQKLREFEHNYESIEIKKKEFTTIIHEAKFDYKQYLVKIAKKNKDTSEDEKKTLPTDRPNTSILILHDVFKKSFQAIGDMLGIGKSTARDRYVKEKEIQNTCLIALENKEIEIEG